MESEIGGAPGSSANDILRVLDGPLTLDGTLRLSLLNGFVPQPTDWFPLAESSHGRNGTFAAVTGYAIAPGQDFAVHYLPGSLAARAGEWRDPFLHGVIDVPGANLNVTGSGTWSGPLVKQGSGHMVVDFANGVTSISTGARLDVQAGHVTLLSDAATPAEPARLRVHVIGGGLTMQATQHLAGLEVDDARRATLTRGDDGGAPRVLRAAALDLHGTGTLAKNGRANTPSVERKTKTKTFGSQ